MKKLLSILLALVMVLSLAALSSCAKTPAANPTPTPTASTPDAPTDDFSTIKAAGKIVIGITEYEPMNYYDANGTLVGFDTEFAEAACAKLGITPVFQVIDWESKEVELAGKTIDCIWNGLTVSEDRRANMDFTQSYLTNQQVVVIRAADAALYTDTASFAGKTLVAEEGSAGETSAEADFPGAAYTAVSSQATALLEVKSGTADAAVIDITMARAMTGAGTDYADLIYLDIQLTDEEYAVGFRLDSSAVAQFDTAIAALKADGTIAGLAAKYDLTELLIG
jgi:polar amino acid transport system substrate-binding protein